MKKKMPKKGNFNGKIENYDQAILTKSPLLHTIYMNIIIVCYR